MMGPEKKYDVLIVGNGVLGYAAAFCLMEKNKDLKIGIIGTPDKRGAASWASGAMLASFAEIEKGSLDSEIEKYTFGLNRKAAALWPQWVARINAYADERFKLTLNFGTYVLHNTRADEADDENIAAIQEVLEQHREPYEIADPSTIKGYSPATEGRSLKILYIPNEGFIPSFKIRDAFENIFAKNKAIEIIPSAAVKITVGGKEKEIITAANAVYKAPVVILAAGSKTQELIDQIPEIKSRIPRQVYGVGTALILKQTSSGVTPEKVIRTANRGLACGVHAVPYDQERCYIGASNFISPVPEYHPRITSLYALLQSAMEQVHRLHYKSQVEQVLVGHRPTTVDTFPVIGETSIKGLWLVSGTKRIGLHMSPFYGGYVAAKIMDGKDTFENKFLPERKLFHTMTREQGIRKAVKHLKSAAYQHELHLPKAGWEDMVEEMLRKKVEKIYDDCGIKNYGIPPELLDMYRYGHVKEAER